MQKPPASAGSGLQSSEGWEWGVLGVTLGWREPEPGLSTARWNQPGQALGTAVAASATPVPGSSGTFRTYPIRGRAPLTPLVLCSKTPPPTGKQPVSEQVRYWSGLITGLSNTAKELLQIFCSHCQNRNTPPAPPFQLQFNFISRKKSKFCPVKCTKVTQRILSTCPWVVPPQVLAEFHFKMLFSGFAHGVKFLRIDKFKGKTSEYSMLCWGSGSWYI